MSPASFKRAISGAFTSTGSLIAEIKKLRDAIAEHRDQRADDRCFLDDQKLYAVLEDGDLGDNHVGDQCAMLENCRRYIAQRTQNGGPWKSYADLERELASVYKRYEELSEILDSRSSRS